MKNEVKKLIGRSVVRLVAYMQSGLDIDYEEYEKYANMASEMNANFSRRVLTKVIRNSRL